jgi:hypothetical protein
MPSAALFMIAKDLAPIPGTKPSRSWNWR